MAKKDKKQKAGGEVLRNATETAQIEQYWHLLGKAKPHKPPKEYNYVEELAHLQLELIKLQEWVRMRGLRVCALFEGRDAAGKGGVIKPRSISVRLYYHVLVLVHHGRASH